MDKRTSFVASDYFGVERVERDDCIHVVISGELDRASTALLEECLAAAGPAKSQQLIIDATALSFCDSAGVKAVLRAHDLCIEAGAKMRVVGVQPSVERVFGLTGVAPESFCGSNTETHVTGVWTDGTA